MKIQPANTCCGCSLYHAVQVICLATLIACITALCLVSSQGNYGNQSTKDILLGSWALIGIPITVTAAVAALYRIEDSLRTYFYYLLASVVFGMCMNPFWTAIAAIPLFYSAFIVWSDCEQMSSAPFPELCRSSDALKYSYSQDEYDKKCKEKAVPTAVVPPTRMSWLMSDGFRRGTPQSFIPQPSSMMSDGLARGTPQSFIPSPTSGFITSPVSLAAKRISQPTSKDVITTQVIKGYAQPGSNGLATTPLARGILQPTSPRTFPLIARPTAAAPAEVEAASRPPSPLRVPLQPTSSLLVSSVL